MTDFGNKTHWRQVKFVQTKENKDSGDDFWLLPKLKTNTKRLRAHSRSITAPYFLSRIKPNPSIVLQPQICSNCLTETQKDYFYTQLANKVASYTAWNNTKTQHDPCQHDQKQIPFFIAQVL